MQVDLKLRKSIKNMNNLAIVNNKIINQGQTIQIYSDWIKAT